MFGNAVCQDDGSCDYSEVIQYDGETDSWSTIGYMQEGRGFQEVIEVPIELCSKAATITTSTPDPPQTTDEDDGTTDGDNTPPPDGGDTTQDDDDDDDDGATASASSFLLVLFASLFSRLYLAA